MKNVERKYLKKILRFNIFAFPFFAILTYVLIVLESVTYPGFIQNHLFFDPEIFFALLIISGFFVVAGSAPFEKFTNFDLLAKLTLLFTPALVLVGSIFLSLERNNYKGYVYTHGFHFDPGYFLYLYIISFLILLIYFTKRRGLFGREVFIDLPKIFLSIFIFSMFIYMGYGNFRLDLTEAKPRLAAVIKHPFADGDWKGRYLFADFYDYMKFVDNQTPPDAVIMRMVQQSKWPTISNDGYVRGFIYPRYTKVGDSTTLNDPQISYVFIHRAYSPPRVSEYIEKWPTFPVKAKELIYMRDNDYTKSPIIVNKDYDPHDHTYDDLWGLIVLERPTK